MELSQLLPDTAMDDPNVDDHSNVTVVMHDEGTPAASIKIPSTRQLSSLSADISIPCDTDGNTSLQSVSPCKSEELDRNYDVEKQLEVELQDAGHKEAQISVVPSNDGHSLDIKTEEIVQKIKSIMECESVDVLESGEIMVLPKKWTMRASKTHDGKKYFVSPFGQTQWLRPPMKTGLQYQWVHELEVTFGDGRLGLNLKQILAEPGVEFSDIQVHISEIYKLANGVASPAEIYNWSVKPEKRLYVGMRVTAINDISLVGYSYGEVLDMINRLQRPLRIKFADISKGVKGHVEERVVEIESESDRETRRAKDIQNLLRLEYFRILVACELHAQVSGIARAQMTKKEIELSKKVGILHEQVEALNELHKLLSHEQEELIQETVTLQSSLETLELQEKGTVDSPEVLRATDLIDRNVVLNQEISELIAENEALRRERITIETLFDQVQRESELYDDLDDQESDETDFFSNNVASKLVEYGWKDASAEDSREQLLEKLRGVHDTLKRTLSDEEKTIAQVKMDIQSLQRQLVEVDEASKRDDDLMSGEKPARVIVLENKIEGLRRTVDEVATAIDIAEQDRNHVEVDTLSKRHNALEDELKAALDEMQKLELELNYRSTSIRQLIADEDMAPDINRSQKDSVPIERTVSDLQTHISLLRSNLHTTVKELARASSTNDQLLVKELSDQRLKIKDELKRIQEECQTITEQQNADNKSPHLPSSSPIPTETTDNELMSPPFDLPSSSSTATENAGSGLRPQIKTDGYQNDEEYHYTTRLSLPNSSERSQTSSSGGFLSRKRSASASVSRKSSIDATSRKDANRNTNAHSESPSLLTVDKSDITTVPRINSNRTNHPQMNHQATNLDSSCVEMPTLSGLLMKHPSHSNERGIFGNMSLRGIRERYVVLDGSNSLKYYKRKGDRDIRGSVPLDDPTLEIVYAKTDVKNLEFSICTPKHQNRFVGKTRDEVLKWVQALETTHLLLMQKRKIFESMGERVSVSGSSRLSGSLRLSGSQPDRATLGF